MTIEKMVIDLLSGSHVEGLMVQTTPDSQSLILNIFKPGAKSIAKGKIKISSYAGDSRLRFDLIESQIRSA